MDVSKNRELLDHDFDFTMSPSAIEVALQQAASPQPPEKSKEGKKKKKPTPGTQQHAPHKLSKIDLDDFGSSPASSPGSPGRMNGGGAASPTRGGGVKSPPPPGPSSPRQQQQHHLVASANPLFSSNESSPPYASSVTAGSPPSSSQMRQIGRPSASASNGGNGDVSTAAHVRESELVSKERHIRELIQFYVRDVSILDQPENPEAQARGLFERYGFQGIATAIQAKYGKLPAGWKEELSRLPPMIPQRTERADRLVRAVADMDAGAMASSGGIPMNAMAAAADRIAQRDSVNFQRLSMRRQSVTPVPGRGGMAVAASAPLSQQWSQAHPSGLAPVPSSPAESTANSVRTNMGLQSSTYSSSSSLTGARRAAPPIPSSAHPSLASGVGGRGGAAPYRGVSTTSNAPETVMGNRILNRLAKRGVAGPEALELAQRITKFYALRAQEQQAQARMIATNFLTGHGGGAGGGMNGAGYYPVAQSPYPTMPNSQQQPGTGAVVWDSSAAPAAQRHQQLREAAAATSPGRTPGASKTKPAVQIPEISKVQATTRTAEPQMDDAFARQFSLGASPDDLRYEPQPPILVEAFRDLMMFIPAAIRGTGTFLRDLLRGRVFSDVFYDEPLHGPRFEERERRRYLDVQMARAIGEAMERYRAQGIPLDDDDEANANEDVLRKKRGGEYLLNRLVSRAARFLDFTRPYWTIGSDWLFEWTEQSNPQTYGLRVPGRRFMLLTGVTAYLVRLILYEYDKVTVSGLKNEVASLVGSQTGYTWPENDATASFDSTLQLYVDQARQASIVYWCGFGGFASALVVETLIGAYGRYSEDKRRAIKASRTVLFMTVPVMCLAGLLPVAPDYVGSVQSNLQAFVPTCAPRLNELVNALISDFFGLGLGVYLSFTILIVSLIVIPATNRALCFIIIKELNDLKFYNLFEPRREAKLTTARVQNARFVWRLFPVLNPVLTYFPFVIIAQLIAKTYVAVLIVVFWNAPYITARAMIHREPEKQSLTLWFWYATFWIILYFVPVLIIGFTELAAHGQEGNYVRRTLANWKWYISAYAQAALPIVLAADLLYLFMANEEDVEPDAIINQYLDAVRNEAQFEAEMQLMGAAAADGAGATSPNESWMLGNVPGELDV